MERKTNKTREVLAHLNRKGSITSLEAINLYGATRLSAIIFNLRKEIDIESIKETCTDRFGNSCTYVRYTIAKSQELKRCPFCGATATIETIRVRKGYEAIIKCGDCGIFMPTNTTYGTSEEAEQAIINAWNSRAL